MKQAQKKEETSPYQSFSLIERDHLKKVADDNTNFALFISDIQRESSHISTSDAFSYKLSGWLFLAYMILQHKVISVFSTPSTSDASGGWFTLSTDSAIKAHHFDHMNFSEKYLGSDFCQTTDYFNYCAPEAKIQKKSTLKNNHNIVSNNCLELTYNQHCYQ